MKRFITTLLIGIFCLTTSTLAQQEWARNIGGTSLDQGMDIVRDRQGNLYVTGFFQGMADFDPSSNVVNLPSNSLTERDIFLAKYDAQGNFIWAKTIGGAGHDHGKSLAIDVAGNIYLAGEFTGMVDFNPNIGFNLFTSQGNTDVFITKFDGNGNLMWAKTFGGADQEKVQHITVDASGHIFLTGFFSGVSDFDPNGGIASFTSAGKLDAYIIKLNNAGNYLWAKTISGTEDIFATDLTIDEQQNIIVSGYFEGTADFDPSTNTAAYSTISMQSGFVAKYTNNGDYIWMNRVAGSGYERTRAIVTDVEHNVYALGTFRGVVDFDNSTNNHSLTSYGDQDIFLTKFSPTGDFLWARNMGGTGEDRGVNLILDNNSNLVVTGFFNNKINIPTDDAIEELFSNGATDILYAKFDKQGQFIEAKKAGGSNGDHPAAIAADDSGNIYTTGWMQGISTFGEEVLTSTGDRDIYIAKFELNTLLSTSTTHLLPENQFNIYPNPSNGAFNIEIGEFEGESFTIRIVDVTGRLVDTYITDSFNVSNSIQSINITDRVNTGLYFVHIQSGKAILTKKIMIRK